jgi:hypothetical protein
MVRNLHENLLNLSACFGEPQLRKNSSKAADPRSSTVE